MKKPTIIDSKNKSVTGSNKAIEATAGPGHKPTNPHPIPNKEAPKSNLLSISFFLR